MKFEKKQVEGLLGILLCCVAAPATASALWDGAWYTDAQASNWPELIEIVGLPGGRWTMFDGAQVRPFMLDGAWHRFSSLATEYRAAQPDPRTLVIAEAIHGREYNSYRLTLAVDGMAMTSERSQSDWSGRRSMTRTRWIRHGKGTSFAGMWMPVPNASGAHAPDGVLKADTTPPLIAWTGEDGVITWYVIGSGELLRGKADGRHYPSIGPIDEGETFSWKIVNPHRLDFTSYVDGAPAYHATEIVSDDGQTMTDTAWYSDHSDTKAITVMHKHPPSAR